MSPPLPRPRAPPALPDELVEEVLLRFPPDDPARLVSAALACKPLCRLVAGSRFRRRFCELHRAPAMLGFLYYRRRAVRFMPTGSFYPPRSPVLDHRHCRAIDARHGRVLLGNRGASFSVAALAVWDPIAHELQELLKMPCYRCRWDSWNAAVLCARASTCDHLDCHRGPFHIVFLGYNHLGMFTCIYSSETCAWRALTCVHEQNIFFDFVDTPSALVRDALCFLFNQGTRILEYNLATGQASVIHVPPTRYFETCTVLMPTEDGGLGFARVEESRLCLWTREVTPDGASWAQTRVIELETLLPRKAITCSPAVVGFADGVGVIFVTTDYGRLLFAIDLKSLRVTKLGPGYFMGGVVPFVRFCTPALGASSTGEGQELVLSA